MKKVEIEQVESCPFCEAESTYPNYDPEKKGYITRCKTCGCEIFLCDACQHAKDNPGGKCDWHSEGGQSVCFRGKYDLPTYANVRDRLPQKPTKNGKLWTDADEILGGEAEINRMADILSEQGEDVCTGYYDPVEDKKNDEVDRYTGYWYLEM